MKKTAVIYHSGVGNTKRVAEKIHQILSKVFDADLYSVEKMPEVKIYNILTYPDKLADSLSDFLFIFTVKNAVSVVNV